MSVTVPFIVMRVGFMTSTSGAETVMALGPLLKQ
jgi:hypothetical protein